MKRWLASFLILSVVDAGLTWASISILGGHEVLGLWFRWLPGVTIQMLYKLGLTVVLGVLAYRIKSRTVLMAGTFAIAVVCVWNIVQIILALS
jgi:hypothetical protein